MNGFPISPDDIDGAELSAIVQRFRANHTARIDNMGTRLDRRHRRVLEALPLLYHRNHPALPGYVGADVPCGISGFRPSERQRRALSRVARTYEEPALTPLRADLQALFLMGSGGTVGQTRNSDVDLWVCCDTLMHAALAPKVRLIDQWAADLGLNLQTFLVDPDDLRERRRLPGCHIPMLVLDEFYRTGALMAGRLPLWWLIDEVDPERYARAAERLLEQRFVAADAVLDFGPVQPFPADELAHAALTELDRALATPHKSLLKLKLVEAYAQAPELGCASTIYRQRIHAGETARLRLDPYLVLYEHVERYLGNAGYDCELPFVRSLLIGKTAESVPLPDGAVAAAGAAPLLERFLGWGFDADEVRRFRDLDGWSMPERLEEHERIMSALADGVELAGRLVARAVTTPSAAPDAAAGPLARLNHSRLRQLRHAVAGMAPRDDQDIAVLHPALISRRRSTLLRLERVEGGWRALEDELPVRHFRRLVEAVVWAELNGVDLVPARAEPAMTRLLAQVPEAFAGRRRAIYAFVNVESQEQRVPPWQADASTSDREPVTLLSLRNDPLDYGGFHQLHLETLDLVRTDGPGRWRVETPADPNAVLTAFGQLLARPADEVLWQVPGGRERFLLADRLEKLHQLAERILAAPGALFVLPFGADMVTVRRVGTQVHTRRHETISGLQAYLRETGCVTVGVDPASRRLKALLRAG